ncbi:TPA: Hsp70 family protein [Stenotrophomonas maltophilia]|uniref:Hsp70 family protein n=1 Tax=Stenotrophomonas maltophilia TaxID=40324 RepID=UPI000C157E5E|nr:Hsp70 family protein [Stenotrophomonas maltophilia]MBA0236203.1 heat-shock protein Hsp70 [Stenotrophomonas maltophilia]MBA0269962.1 heat-shock protein Hsp70 [Stenotrophomonas maltophilia]MBA0334014.1 heat-shock protein Hsp70 [Stenotrophomonas maltophilia]MBN5123656.1 Hsp70 family protein [Stenotrophomonas maltophilia]MBO3005214.1 Hsp70 family protein [Stenotrophomonas maltophilia]
MRLGIDFGTSNSAAAIVHEGKLLPIRFGDAEQFRTSVYFPGVVPDPDDFQLDDGQEHQLQQMIDSAARAARAAGQERTPQALRREALRALRREWMEARAGKERSASDLLQNAVYGDDALEAYFEEHEGNLVQSPKSMLGYNLHPRAKQTITGIAAHILEHIRLTASAQLGQPLRAALLGRPVQFRSSIGAAGNDQALDILREAATQAGFDQIDFLEEPAAAAMHYHAESRERHQAVIVDIGGGTTDIAHAEVGGDDAPRIHRAWGIARGGTDIDLALSLSSYMPLFGRGITRVPAHHYVEAATVQDMTRQRDFRQHKYDHVDEPWCGRLQALQDTGNTARLYRDVERAKIALSAASEHRSTLDYIARDLHADSSADGLAAAAHGYLEQIRELLAQVRSDIGGDPDAVFLTGGMSRAGYLRQAVAEAFPGARMVHGEPSLGVVQGLALAAASQD